MVVAPENIPVEETQGGETEKTLEQVQREMDSAARQDLLGGRRKVGPFTVNPVTLAHLTVLQEINSPLLKGINVSDIRNPLLECLIAVVVCQRDLSKEEELVGIVASMGAPGWLKAEALKAANTVQNVDTQDFIKAVLDLLKEATSTQVKATPPRDPNRPSPELLEAAGITEPGNG